MIADRDQRYCTFVLTCAGLEDEVHVAKSSAVSQLVNCTIHLILHCLIVYYTLFIQNKYPIYEGSSKGDLPTSKDDSQINTSLQTTLLHAPSKPVQYMWIQQHTLPQRCRSQRSADMYYTFQQTQLPNPPNPLLTSSAGSLPCFARYPKNPSAGLAAESRDCVKDTVKSGIAEWLNSGARGWQVGVGFAEYPEAFRYIHTN